MACVVRNNVRNLLLRIVESYQISASNKMPIPIILVLGELSYNACGIVRGRLVEELFDNMHVM